MSKATRAQTSAAPTTLRPSAQPLHPGAPEPGEIPEHTEPFKAFDWLDGADHVDPATRALVNDTVNICTGAALALRIVEQCAMVGDFSPEVVTLPDGYSLEQPAAPYLNPSDCAALAALAAASMSLLADRAQQLGEALRRSAPARA